MPAARRNTVDDLLALGSDVRAELIDGEIQPKAMPSRAHSFAQGNLLGWLLRRYMRKLVGRWPVGWWPGGWWPGGWWPGGWWIGPELHVVYSPKHVYCHDLVGSRARS